MTYKKCFDADSVFHVRLLIGDTDDQNHYLKDEEIAFFISETADVYYAAHRAAQAISAKLSSGVDVKFAGGTTENLSQRVKHWNDLALKLKRQADVRGGVPYFTAASKNDKENEEDDSDRVTPAFSRDLHMRPQTMPDPADTEDC